MQTPNAPALPVEWTREEVGPDGRLVERLWTPADGSKARPLEVVYGAVENAELRKLKAAKDREFEGKVCKNCKHFLNDPADAEAQKATRLAWEALVKDSGFSNHHFDPTQFAPCIAHFEDSAAAFTMANASCEDFRPRSSVSSFHGKILSR